MTSTLRTSTAFPGLPQAARSGLSPARRPRSPRPRGAAVTAALLPLLLLAACATPSSAPTVPRYDLVVLGGRVIDPETGLDRITNLGVQDGRIAAITDAPLEGQRRIDAKGLVVAPGFIDLHSHAQVTPSMYMQAFDGVTTALELELGNLPIAASYEVAAREGRPIHYGFSVSWALARMKVLDGETPDGRTDSYVRHFARPGWRSLTTRERSAAVLAEVEQGLREGGLGIGLMLGYGPDSNREEYLGAARLAARYDVPTFTHIRATNNIEPRGSYEGFAEVIAAAAGTGAHMHLCHINSSSWRQIGLTTEFIAQAQSRGLHITTEAYPYGASSTQIGAAAASPDNLPLRDMPATNIYMVDTGRWIGSSAELAQVRRERPNATAVFHALNEAKPEELALLDQALLFHDTALASDAIPYTLQGKPIEGRVWPLPEGANAHPRIAGTHAKVFAHWVRERHLLSLQEAIRRSTLLPAQIMETAAPAMKHKGRLQVGADADIVAFDADRFSDRASYEHPALPSEGMQYVLVGGVPLIHEGQLDTTVMPGAPVRGPMRTTPP
ncbi:MAG: amidohydrolase family protein [Curvibacter sp.]|nr:amidohydrolase family protein [Curvibacter sp.]